MASLTTGSVNFPNQIYENPPQLVEDLARSMLQFDVKPEVEVFDLAMLYNARDLAERALIKRPLHVQFVLGVPNALPARRLNFWCRSSRKSCLTPPGPQPVSAAINWRSIAGRWSLVAIAYRH
jgi:uncharacterized protein (DUF849 family)